MHTWEVKSTWLGSSDSSRLIQPVKVKMYYFSSDKGFCAFFAA